jgi:hypothetical protein
MKLLYHVDDGAALSDRHLPSVFMTAHGTAMRAAAEERRKKDHRGEWG